MSLFKLRHLWIQSFPDEQFDQHHISIGNIDDLPAIALASFSGRLLIYWVLPDKKFEVLLIYNNTFQSPVISVEFVSLPQEKSKNNNTLGVLLFRKFLYITLRKNPQKNTFDSKQIPLSVQPAFAIQPQTPSILTLNSSIQHLNPTTTQPFKISSPIYPFARSGHNFYYADGQQLVMMKNSTQQWRVIVGPMRSLYLFRNSTVVVIGDNALWEVVQTSIQKTKVMEQDVSCGNIIDKDTDYNIVVANFSNQILIYTSSYQLIWATKAEQVPIKICIFNNKALFGAMALLGQQGTISISYLGSQLPQSSIQPLNQQIDMQQVQAQTQKLLTQLRAKQDKQIQNTGAVQSQSQNKGDVKIILSPKQPRKNKQIILPNQKQSGQYYREDGILWCCDIQCVIKAERQGINDVLLTVTTPSNIHCIQNNYKWITIKNSEKFVLQFVVSCQKFPYSNTISVTVRYDNADKRRGTSVITQTCDLPLDFQCRFKSTQLQQKPVNKIVFKAQNDLPPFSQIFNEFESSIKSSKNMTVSLPNGISVSMGYNKNNTKVKVESNFFSGLCYIFVVFADRFRKLVQNKKINNNQLSIDDIPLEQFFTLMKQHFTLRETFKQRSADLQTKCEQFRNVQKKLIIKMKEKASSINNIDKLLQYTYRRLISAADLYEQATVQIQKVTHNLQVAITFVLELLFMKSKATLKCRQKVMGIIGFQRQSVSMEYGWEEKIMANSAHFLNKKYNYTTDKYTFDQLYKTALWVISKINSGEWN